MKWCRNQRKQNLNNLWISIALKLHRKNFTKDVFIAVFLHTTSSFDSFVFYSKYGKGFWQHFFTIIFVKFVWGSLFKSVNSWRKKIYASLTSSPFDVDFYPLFGSLSFLSTQQVYYIRLQSKCWISQNTHKKTPLRWSDCAK